MVNCLVQNTHSQNVQKYKGVSGVKQNYALCVESLKTRTFSASPEDECAVFKKVGSATPKGGRNRVCLKFLFIFSHIYPQRNTVRTWRGTTQTNTDRHRIGFLSGQFFFGQNINEILRENIVKKWKEKFFFNFFQALCEVKKSKSVPNFL